MEMKKKTQKKTQREMQRGMQREDLLVNRLVRYGKTNMYPFHMPGHKRTGSMGFPDPFTVDITEIDGFDNLHHPEGILKRSMEWAAGVYGADRTYYLVNGSSSGILSAICGTVPRGGRILVSRNCHKAVYHGIFLNQLKASYVYPQEVPGLGIQGGITPQDVDQMLRRYMDTKAVLIVSPTYDGVVSDIRGIAQVVHRAGLPLIVDEAHGAHFRYGEMFPCSALDLGADVVIQSVHKTMPSLTQTALLHIKNNRPEGGCYANAQKIDRYIHMVQTTSPSYVLMASIENSIYQMEHMDLEPYSQRLGTLRQRLSGLKCLRLAGLDLKGTSGIFDLDCSKIVLSTRGTSLADATGWEKSGIKSGINSGINRGDNGPGSGQGRGPGSVSGAGPGSDSLPCFTGAMLDDILRRVYRLEMEMCGADYVTAISTVMDNDQGLSRLGDALCEIDSRLKPVSWDTTASSVYSMRSDTAMTIADAMDGELHDVKLKDSAGCISGEFIYIYPPGITIVAAGEWIRRRALDIILEYMDKKLPVQGPEDQELTYLKAVKTTD